MSESQDYLDANSSGLPAQEEGEEGNLAGASHALGDEWWEEMKAQLEVLPAEIAEKLRASMDKGSP